MSDEHERGADPSFDRYARMVRRALGVPVALVSIVEENRQVFTGAVGLPQPYQDSRETPLSHSFCQYVARDEKPLVIEDARVHPVLRTNLAIEDLQVVAYAGWPITDHTGRTIGSLCAIDSSPRTWSSAELETLEDLAAACSAELAERERRRSADARAADADRLSRENRVRLALAEGLVAASTFEEVAAAVEDAAITHLGCSGAGLWLRSGLANGSRDAQPEGLLTFSGSDRLQRVPSTRDEWARATEHASVTVTDPTPFGWVTRRAMPMFFSDHAEQDTVFPEMAASSGAAEARAVMPVGIGAYTFGALVLTFREPRQFSDSDRATAAALASYVAQAVERAWALHQRVETSEILQAAMLSDLPEVEGLSSAARYRSADRGKRVGGDWYDLLARSDGSVAVAVGDVVGHDIQAAADMGQLRSMLRAIAWTGDDDPAATLGELDRSIVGLEIDAMASLVFGVLTRGTGHAAPWTFTWASAGHPPPLLVDPAGEVTWLVQERRAPMLGIDIGTAHRGSVVQIEPGSTLVLYTDGLVERRGEVLDLGLERLGAAAQRGHGGTAEAVATGLLAELVPDRIADDVALLVLTFGD
ncbi:GAF domain-containing SpoIIE family protein phosphatase [Aeromicrobium sp. Sec7.5]|uniref:GAF domain-containing SpoIIE family protein phosphatase n=1 Tax=Aeromicrobium sp. Sec7.5 TaxID=3121276 RepID=UPI002FE4C84D